MLKSLTTLKNGTAIKNELKALINKRALSEEKGVV
jgi:hypothetical protein